MTYDNELLKQGKVLPLMETFYTLQGEGYNTGKAAWFLRIGGCDVGCKWCDIKESWNPELFPPTPLHQIIQQVTKDNPAKSIVVTGGEPLLYNLNPLCNELKALNYQLFLETSGSEPLSGTWDWICLSPKKNSPPHQKIFTFANELKVIVFDPSDIDWAEENAAKVSPDCILYLQPEWSQRKTMIPMIVDYILAHPKWKISLQSHKYMNIP